jgi:hypothetical protein
LTGGKIDAWIQLLCAPALRDHFAHAAVAQHFKAYEGQPLAFPAEAAGPKPEYLEVPEQWALYLRQHQHILRDFCLWNLAHFVQARNPNVPQVVNKLVKPPSRAALTQQRDLWNAVLDHTGGLACIYTGMPSLRANTTLSTSSLMPSWRTISFGTLCLHRRHSTCRRATGYRIWTDIWILSWRRTGSC